MDSINTISDHYREQVISLGLAIRPTHWITLNTHQDFSLDYAMRCLKRWRVEILRRLCGRRFFDRAEDELIAFAGCPESSLAGHPHFHLVCRVPCYLSERFIELAATRWNAIVPSGTIDIQLIDKHPASPRRAMQYATKRLNSKSPVPFVHSNLFH